MIGPIDRVEPFLPEGPFFWDFWWMVLTHWG
jgi:hypothetical protein